MASNSHDVFSCEIAVCLLCCFAGTSCIAFDVARTFESSFLFGQGTSNPARNASVVEKQNSDQGQSDAG